MTPELEVHLRQIVAVLQTTKKILSRFGYPHDLRTVLVIALMDQMIEHHEAMSLLIRAEKVGSSFALARSVFEALFRGAWMQMCATEGELALFEKTDKLPLKMAEMANAIDEKSGISFFEDLRKRGWTALNSYTHTGLLQLGRRFTGDSLQPAYSDAEIIEVTTSSTTCILVLVRLFLAGHGHGPDAQEIDALTTSFGAASQHAENTSST